MIWFIVWFFHSYFLSCPLSQVTGERYCRAQQEAHHDSHTYLCLLASTRNHMILHNLYHGKGERSPEEVAGLVGLRLPTQPGGKGWEKWGHGKEILTLFRNDLSVADSFGLIQFPSCKVNSKGINIWLESGGLEIVPSWTALGELVLFPLCCSTNVQIWWWSVLRVTVKIYAMIKENLLFSCKYTVPYSLSTPAFVCVLAVLLTVKKAATQKDCTCIFILIHLSH